MRQNLELFWEVNNGNYPSEMPEENGRDIWMREMFCIKDGMRDYMEQKGRICKRTSIPSLTSSRQVEQPPCAAQAISGG